MSAKVRNVCVVTWTETEIERLKFLWAEGWSAGTIGKELGRTRNSIIGRDHRMKLETVGHQNNHQKVRVKRMTKPKNKPHPTRPVLDGRAIPTIAVDVSALKGRAWEPLAATTLVELTTLGHRCCKWPIGLDSPFLFCAARTDVGSPWCPTHRAMAFSNRPLVRL